MTTLEGNVNNLYGSGSFLVKRIKIAYPVHITVVGQIDIASWVRELSLAGKHKAEVMPSLKVYSR